MLTRDGHRLFRDCDLLALIDRFHIQVLLSVDQDSFLGLLLFRFDVRHCKTTFLDHFLQFLVFFLHTGFGLFCQLVRVSFGIDL